jgi:DNA-binding MarR family transcriptional regulator
MIENPLRAKEEDLARILRKIQEISSESLSAAEWKYDLAMAAAYTGSSTSLRLMEKIAALDDDEEQGVDFLGFSSPKKKDIEGLLRLGVSLPEQHPFGLSPGQINRNVSITGTIGKGKTTTIVMLSVDLHDQGVPFLIISTSKKDMRHLIRQLPDIQVIRGEDFRFNLLEKNKWLKLMAVLSDFIDVYCHEIEVMMRSKGYLTKVMKDLRGIFGEQWELGVNPNLEDMRDILIEKMKTPGFKKDDFLIRNIQRLDTILFLSGEIFSCSTGFKLEKLLGHPIVLELDDLSDTVANMLMVALLTKILRFRIEKGVRGKLQHVIVIDEAKRILNRAQEKSTYARVPPIIQLISVCRDLGQGLIAADQQISQLSDTFLSCACSKIAFSTSGKDIYETAKIFGLNPQQTGMLQELPTGYAIVKQDQGHTKPFLAKMDKIEFPKDVTEDEVVNHSRKFIEWLNRDVQPRSTVILERAKLNEERKQISRDEEIILISVAKRPELIVSERLKSIGFTTYMGIKLLKSLSYKGFINKRKIQTGQRGNQPVIIELTDKAKEYLKAKEIRIRSKGKGGVVNQWWQKKIQEFYKNIGMETVIEPNVSGVNADVLVMNAKGKRIAIEVALSQKGQAENIQRDLKYFDRVIMASQTKLLMDKIVADTREVLGQDELKRVKFCLLGDFLP